MSIGDRIARRLQSHPMVAFQAKRLGISIVATVFKAGDQVLLGNGDRGKILKECTGPTGFKSYHVQVTGSVAANTVGRRVYATTNGMAKTGSLAPDLAISFYDADRHLAVVGCEIAHDETQQEIGLQKYSSLPTGAGMIFPYDPPKNVMFHMGSVSFPIDIVFVNPQGYISSIYKDCHPGTREHWKSRGRVAAVVEVNGGFCDAYGIGVGHSIRASITKSAQETIEQVMDGHSRAGPPSGLADDMSSVVDSRGHATPAEVEESASVLGAGPTSDQFVSEPGRNPMLPSDGRPQDSTR